jgi:hypothetical protein
MAALEIGFKACSLADSSVDKEWNNKLKIFSNCFSVPSSANGRLLWLSAGFSKKLLISISSPSGSCTRTISISKPLLKCSLIYL